MKIIYCLNSIRYLGGIQKITIVKANALAEIQGNEIYIVVTDNDKNAIITNPLSDKVKLIDLDINYYTNDWKSKWNVLVGIFKKRLEHKRKLKAVFNDIQPDIVISVGQSEKYLILSIPGSWIRIREIHYTKNYRMLIASSLFDKIIAFCSNFYDYNIKIKEYDKIVLLTNEDKNRFWKNCNNICVIPNPITLEVKGHSFLLSHKIISVGRLEEQKDFKSMIYIFKKVTSCHPDWILNIYGEGSQKEELQELIQKLNLQESVFLKGLTLNITEEMKESSIFLLTSKFEGFGLVLLEAMACGLPVVSYSCPCGPKDIIDNGKDGFLIPMDDKDLFAASVNKLIENENLRKQMGNNAIVKSDFYNTENIIKKWMKLFNNLLLYENK